MSAQVEAVAQYMADGLGDRKIAEALRITRHQARNLMRDAERQKSTAVAVIEPEPSTRAEFAERITGCWRKSFEAVVDAGRWLNRAKCALDHGEFGQMVLSDLPFGERTAQRLMAIASDERLTNPTHVSHLPNAWGTLYELHKLPDDAFEAQIADGSISPDMERKEAEVLVAKSGPTRSMRRTESSDSLDYFATPPWATRSLIERVFPQLGMHPSGHTERTIWEPACGEGHMSGVLQEYSECVFATDIHDYTGNVVKDFMTCDAEPGRFAWIITNPPFKKDENGASMAESFVLRALDLAYEGVAMFVALQFLEGVGRYERIFRDRPPTLISFFAERVNCIKGRWDPDGSTDAAYVWLVWHKDRSPQAPYWIPPGQRKALSKPDDREKYAAWSLKAEAAE